MTNTHDISIFRKENNMNQNKIQEIEKLEKKYEIDAVILFKLLASKDTDYVYFKFNNTIITLQMDFDVSIDLDNKVIKVGDYKIIYPLKSYGELWSLNKEDLKIMEVV